MTTEANTTAETELDAATRSLRGLHARRTAVLAELAELNERIPEALLRRDRAAALLRTSEPPRPLRYEGLKTRLDKAPQTYDPSNVKDAPPKKF